LKPNRAPVAFLRSLDQGWESDLASPRRRWLAAGIHHPEVARTGVWTSDECSSLVGASLDRGRSMRVVVPSRQLAMVDEQYGRVVVAFIGVAGRREERPTWGTSSWKSLECRVWSGAAHPCDALRFLLDGAASFERGRDL